MENKETKKEGLESVETVLNRTENFFEKNQKVMLIAFAAVIIIAGGIIAYFKFVQEPKKLEAQTELYKAEFAFEEEDFTLALNGNDEFMGFADIIEEYGSTPSGNAACYYAGVCCMRIGEFQKAIDYLDEFDSKDPMLAPMAINLKGDANMELGDSEKAAKLYVEAADKANNEYLSPIFLMKAGNTYETLNKYQEALDIYNRIEKDYYKTPEQNSIEKYIERVEMKLNK